MEKTCLFRINLFFSKSENTEIIKKQQGFQKKNYFVILKSQFEDRCTFHSRMEIPKLCLSVLSRFDFGTCGYACSHRFFGVVTNTNQGNERRFFSATRGPPLTRRSTCRAFGSFFIAWVAFGRYSLLSRFYGFGRRVGKLRIAFWLQK